jgi:hypothetical protein
MRVEVYWNLHKRMFSVRALEGPNKGRVIRHSYAVDIADARFIVQKAGRSRVLKNKRKNVHAFVRGIDVSSNRLEPRPQVPNRALHGVEHITYNPYKHDSFVIKSSSTPVSGARYCLLDTMIDKRVYPRIVAFGLTTV